ncbi:hypothetical protein SAMN05421766_101388 [Zobellia uliginosa]|uniref:Uncharacterized protein n=1 Tax=Zobellia uliginosa TaxID=143224 RepID=A0ABY1KIK1_9FLAO|nr:hypothetical protein SAMN05421766_101388 [Zobellia uliginosa]
MKLGKKVSDERSKPWLKYLFINKIRIIYNVFELCYGKENYRRKSKMALNLFENKKAEFDSAFFPKSYHELNLLMLWSYEYKAL